jgi:CRISPR-associated protein Cmr3
MSRYLITLTPIDKFFFGGEITFTRGKDEKKELKRLTDEEKELKNFDEAFSSYIVKSNPFPQQTSLLGMLRFLLLSSDNDLFALNKIKQGKQNAVAKLIGETSFNLNNNDFSRIEFGKIKFIFPCFIQRQTGKDTEWQNYIPAPFDCSLGKVSFEQGKSLLDEEKAVIPVIDNYYSKKGLPQQYINTNNGYFLETSDIFKEDERIGIDRDFEGKTKTGAFYKQVFYRFNVKYEERKFRFAFCAELDYDFSGNNNFIVSLGGDNSRFSLQAEIVDESFNIELPKEYSEKKNFDNCYAKLILLSDALIEKEAIANCLYSINDTVSFRFLTSDISTQNYYKFSGQSRLKRSDKKYNLYKRGSVFYFDSELELEKFKNTLENKKRFRQIGYNQYEIINNNNQNKK